MAFGVLVAFGLGALVRILPAAGRPLTPAATGA